MIPLQYSDDDAPNAYESEDSLDFLDELLTETSDRWKVETATTVSKTFTGRGNCRHLVSALQSDNTSKAEDK